MGIKVVGLKVTAENLSVQLILLLVEGHLRF
jgi:hypothetical protein